MFYSTVCKSSEKGVQFCSGKFCDGQFIIFSCVFSSTVNSQTMLDHFFFLPVIFRKIRVLEALVCFFTTKNTIVFITFCKLTQCLNISYGWNSTFT